MLASAVLVFLSYASVDGAVAHDIENRLRMAGCKVWNYQHSQPLIGEWQWEAEKAIDRADIVVAVVSRAYRKSRWARKELAYADESEKPIVPVVIEAVRLPFVLSGLTRVPKERIGEVCKESKP